MIERALKGGRNYWTLVGVLLILIGAGVVAYLYQFTKGLGVTGLSRDVPWGFYIAQFTFLVGVAASAVMVVLPYYLHDYKEFGKLAVLGEFLAIAAVIMCPLFILVDLGQPMRGVNIMLYPSPTSLMFWDLISIGGYLILNVLISMITFGAERKGIAPPKWIRPFIILSIPWAISIHTVTAFLYSGLAARPFWLTAILAPRFLASAFASGPSVLIILCFIVRRFTKFDPGEKAIQTLGKIVAYAMAINVFFVGVEVFTAAYSQMPEHLHHFQFLYFGYKGNTALVPWMWTSAMLAVGALILLLSPNLRKNEGNLLMAAIAVIIAIWIEKGLGMVVTGFVPSPLGKVTTYWPTYPEGLITLGVYAIGLLILTVLYKVGTSVREELSA
jgi:molybdopterin-containing oxidoreductase family membrane subunit